MTKAEQLIIDWAEAMRAQWLAHGVYVQSERMNVRERSASVATYNSASAYTAQIETSMLDYADSLRQGVKP